MVFRSALGGAEGHLWPLCHLPDYLSFSFEIAEVFFLRLDIILAAFGGKGWGGESPCSEMKTSRCLDCSWLEMNHFV